MFCMTQLFMEIEYLFYFLIGGVIVSAVTYFASHAKGLLAAFIATFPLITAITLLTIYFKAGHEAAISYARGLIIMICPWIVYIVAIIYLTHRLGFIPSLIIGIVLYLILAYLILNRSI